MQFPTLQTVLFFAALALPAAAQTLQPALEQRYESGQYLITLGASTVNQHAGIDLRNGPGNAWIFDFCADFSAGVNNSSHYNVSAGFGSLTLDQADDLSALLYNTLPVFDGMVRDAITASGDDWPDVGYSGYNDLLAYAAGMQLALWEIIHDPASGDLDSGNFSVDTVADPDVALGRSNADAFLDGIAGGWTSQPGFTFEYARPTDAGGTPVPNGQDRLWVVIPEPSSALLGAFGLLFLLRRRRA
ncbi:hypothetical protein OKA05_12325 [Luteolibacter arcticus]|uniref:PEP-CTERM protein-sorting domain-containing protein n=1 Tax=Luteolibacter arcticus TaxID=1581411 RepID=A0ABT3GIM0_9BACT|nr:hypothetical protein [Luteolibacter arcticus]MCW1923342.1 hypothetical protein [Luteolibacter arcticus]